MSGPWISFVVPVRNDAARLDRCLASIRQNVGADRHEVIVIDHDSTDDSAAVARRHDARVVTVRDAVGVAELRNRGARAALGGVLGFVDADNEIAAGWSLATLENLHAPEVGAVGALCLPPLDGTWVQRAYGAMRGRVAGVQEVSWLGSGNMAVRRDAFETLGGFDTSLETCEDVDFCQRLRRLGFRIISDERLKNVHHGDPATLGALFQGERWRGRDNVRVSFRRPLAWTALPSALLPIVDLVMLVVAFIGLLVATARPAEGFLTAAAAILVIAAGVWLRVARTVTRDRSVRGLAILQVLLVAGVYDLGRACALVTPAPHRNVRTEPAAAA